MTRHPMPRAVGWSVVLWTLVVLGGGGVAVGFPSPSERLSWLLWLPLWGGALLLVAEAWGAFWEEAPVFEMSVPVVSAEEALSQWRDARRALWLLPWLGVCLWPLAWGQKVVVAGNERWRGSAVLLWVAVAISVWIFRRRAWWFGVGVMVAGGVTWWAGPREVWKLWGASGGWLLGLGGVFVVWCGVILRYLRGEWAFRSSFQIAWWLGLGLGFVGLWVERAGALQVGQRLAWWGLLGAWAVLGGRMLWRSVRMIREQRLFQAWSLDAALFATSVPWACLCALWAWEIVRRSAIRQGASMEMMPVLGWFVAQGLLYGALLVFERLYDTQSLEGWGVWFRGMMFFCMALFVLGFPAMVFLRP